MTEKPRRARPTVAFALLPLVAATHGAAARAADPGEPAQTVAAITASVTDWTPHLDAIGSLRAVAGADLSAETAGIVSAIHFRSGADVQAGDVLVELRLNDEPGRLAQAEAALSLAAINLARDERQLAANAVSRAVVDQDKSALDGDRAQVTAEQALIAEKIVRAPFAGRLGIRLVDLGQYLPAGTAMVTLQALDPIYMDFYVPQNALAAVQVGDPVAVSVDSYPGRRFPGRVLAVTPRVDAASRTVQVRATLENRDHALLPGMFGTVSVTNTRLAAPRYVTLPQAAIAFTTYGDTVFVLRPDADGRLVAHQVLVTTGATRGDQVAITAGIGPGDRVVTAGQVKLHDGTPVTVDDRVQPSDNPSPNPPEE